MDQRAAGYGELVSGITGLIDGARRAVARSGNSILAASCWDIGRRIVEFEQKGEARAEYGEALLSRLAKDLRASHGRGFSRANFQLMRLFYIGWEIVQTPSGQLEARTKCQTPSGESEITQEIPSESSILQTPSAKCSMPSSISGLLPTDAFPLYWSQYLTSLPDEKTLRAQIMDAQRAIRLRPAS